MLFLYPLMLQAYKDLPYHALLRGSLDGIPPSHARAVLSSSGDRFRKGVLANVRACTRGWRTATRTSDGREVKQQMRRAGFNKELLDATLGKLEKVVRRAGVDGRARRRGRATARTTPTTPRRRQRKAAFVREAAGRRRAPR